MVHSLAQACMANLFCNLFASPGRDKSQLRLLLERLSLINSFVHLTYLWYFCAVVSTCFGSRYGEKDAIRAFGVSAALRAAVVQRLNLLLHGDLEAMSLVPPNPDLIEEWKRGRHS